MSCADLLQIQFDLTYYTSVTVSDVDQMPLTDLRWMHNRLVQKKRDESGVKAEQFGN